MVCLDAPPLPTSGKSIKPNFRTTTSHTESDLQSGHSTFAEIWWFVGTLWLGIRLSLDKHNEARDIFQGGWGVALPNLIRGRGQKELQKMSIDLLRFLADGFPSNGMPAVVVEDEEPFPSYQRWTFLFNDASPPIYACAPNLKWNCQISISICCCCCCCCCYCAKAKFPPFVIWTLSSGFIMMFSTEFSSFTGTKSLLLDTYCDYFSTLCSRIK